MKFWKFHSARLNRKLEKPLSKGLVLMRRKLSIRFHPDKNPDDPTSTAKFILITKAYECLTDEKAKVNCAKFGNPDGEGSF